MVDIRHGSRMISVLGDIHKSARLGRALPRTDPAGSNACDGGRVENEQVIGNVTSELG